MIANQTSLQEISGEFKHRSFSACGKLLILLALCWRSDVQVHVSSFLVLISNDRDLGALSWDHLARIFVKKTSKSNQSDSDQNGWYYNMLLICNPKTHIEHLSQNNSDVIEVNKFTSSCQQINRFLMIWKVTYEISSDFPSQIQNNYD